MSSAAVIRSLTLALRLLLIAILVACETTPSKPSRESALSQAERAYNSGLWLKAYDEGTAAEAVSQGDDASRAALIAGCAAARLGEVDRAEALLERASRSQNADIRARALASLGSVRVATGDRAQGAKDLTLASQSLGATDARRARVEAAQAAPVVVTRRVTPPTTPPRRLVHLWSRRPSPQNRSGCCKRVHSASRKPQWRGHLNSQEHAHDPNSPRPLSNQCTHQTVAHSGAWCLEHSTLKNPPNQCVEHSDDRVCSSSSHRTLDSLQCEGAAGQFIRKCAVEVKYSHITARSASGIPTSSSAPRIESSHASRSRGPIDHCMWRPRRRGCPLRSE